MCCAVSSVWFRIATSSYCRPANRISVCKRWNAGRRRGGDVHTPPVHCAQSRLQGVGQFRQTRLSYPYTSVVVLRQTARKNPDLVERFLKCMVEGAYIFKTNKAKTLAALRKYMKGADEDILEESYQYTHATIDEAPHPYVAIVKGGLEMLSLQYPNAKQTDANLIVEPAFMKRIEDSGFIRGLYKR